jgi:hypothetical protein
MKYDLAEAPLNRRAKSDAFVYALLTTRILLDTEKALQLLDISA